MDDTETDVLLRWSDGSGPSLLVNSAAAYFPSFDRAALPIGRAFDDPRLALTIKSVASGGSGVEHWIDVSIDFNAGDQERDNPPLLPEMPGAYQIKGHVVDENNQPIAKCRVHNGRMNSVVGDRSDFVSTQTDRDGNYTLWVDDPGPFTVGVSAYGYTAAPGASERVVSIPSPGITNANFSLRTLPRVTVTAVPQISKGDTAIFTIHRTGPTDEPLQVDWQRTGTVHGLDSPGVAQRGTVLILSGQSSTTVSMPTVFDNLAEAPETLTLHAITPGALDRDGILFSYPGWELRGEGADEKWYQTDPAFATYADASATVTIVNSQSATLQLVLNTGSLATLQIVGPANGKIRIDTSADLITWQPVATNQLGASGATVALPTQSPADSRFYRAQKVE
jgi:hypothetical protein